MFVQNYFVPIDPVDVKIYCCITKFHGNPSNSFRKNPPLWLCSHTRHVAHPRETSATWRGEIANISTLESNTNVPIVSVQKPPVAVINWYWNWHFLSVCLHFSVFFHNQNAVSVLHDHYKIFHVNTDSSSSSSFTPKQLAAHLCLVPQDQSAA